MLDNTAKNIAERAWAGDIVLPESPAEFYSMLKVDVRMPPKLSFASTVVSYTPKGGGRGGRDRHALSLAYTFGRAQNQDIIDIPERVGKSVSEVYNHAYQELYLQPLIELRDIAAKFVGSIRAPEEGECVVIVGRSHAHLFAMCERVRSAAVALNRANLVGVIEGACKWMNGASGWLNKHLDNDEKVAVLLFAGFANYTILGEKGLDERISDALDITSLVDMMTAPKHPQYTHKVLQCVRNITVYNNNED